jgi:hypothetical protein
LKNGLFVRLIFIIDHFSSPSEVDYNDQWLTAGSKNNKKELDVERGVERGNKGGPNNVYNTEGDRNQHEQSTKQG